MCNLYNYNRKTLKKFQPWKNEFDIWYPKDFEIYFFTFGTYEQTQPFIMMDEDNPILIQPKIWQ